MSPGRLCLEGANWLRGCSCLMRQKLQASIRKVHVGAQALEHFHLQAEAQAMRHVHLHVRCLAWVEVRELASPGTADKKVHGDTRCASVC